MNWAGNRELTHTLSGPSAHVVWNIPKRVSSPAVLITAYRPDPDRWDLSQRDLAREMGISLGKVNFCLKRDIYALAKKLLKLGLIKGEE